MDRFSAAHPLRRYVNSAINSPVQFLLRVADSMDTSPPQLRDALPQLRFEIIEAARILRMSRAALYQRIRSGELKTHKDGRRSYVTATELQRYVASKSCQSHTMV